MEDYKNYLNGCRYAGSPQDEFNYDHIGSEIIAINGINEDHNTLSKMNISHKVFRNDNNEYVLILAGEYLANLENSDIFKFYIPLYSFIAS